MKSPTLQHESHFWKKQKMVCGIDEVGRGAFAGPLTAAGIILKPINHSDYATISALLSLGINDSKLIKSATRKEIIKSAQKYILTSVVESISVEQINELGIGIVNKMAFSNIAKKLKNRAKNNDIFFLTDCFPIPEVPESCQKNIIHGDQISISIALASIIAKVHRDTYMEGLSVKFPEYGFEKHKGYGTKFHRDIIKTSGITPHHRSKFVARYV